MSNATDSWRQRRKLLLFLVSAIAIFGGTYVLYSSLGTLRTLDVVEAERDSWQRPADVLRALELRDGNTVVDLGSGAGYFTLKISPLVGSRGAVLAVDIRTLSLSFLWIRARLRSPHNIRVMTGEENDPHLKPGTADAVLIANTYHEFRNPGVMLGHVFGCLRPGGRLVVVDRGVHVGSGVPPAGTPIHGIPMDEVEAALRSAGFEIVTHEESFIDRPNDERWWLLAARKP